MSTFEFTLKKRFKEMYQTASDCPLEIEKSYYFYCDQTGTGKTFQSLQFAKKWLKNLHENFKVEDYEESEYIAFMEFSELQNDFMRNYLGTLEKIELAKNIPFLVLDDLGAGNETKSGAELAGIIINYRYNEGLQTFITSNLSVENLVTKYDQRLDRINEMCKNGIIETPRIKFRDTDFARGNTFSNSKLFQKLSERKIEIEQKELEYKKLNEEIRQPGQKTEPKSNKTPKEIMLENIQKGKLNHLQEKLKTGQINQEEFENQVKTLGNTSDFQIGLLKVAQKLMQN